VIDGLADAAATYTQLRVQTSLHPFNSDHVSFLDAQVPAVLTIEGTDDANHHIHSANDTLSHINYALALEILRMNVAFVAAVVGSTD
jgi:Zn-dependent M28 family amino/carboxypeptidase